MWVSGAPDDIILRFEAVSAGNLAGCALDGGGEGARHAGEGEAGGVGCYGATVKGGRDHLEEAGGWVVSLLGWIGGRGGGVLGVVYTCSGIDGYGAIY